jgi:hypothetical protein
MPLKRVLMAAAILLVVYALALAWAYSLMRRPPVAFASAIGKLPPPVFMILPFETLWNRARAGSLAVGDIAPDFHLSTLDKSSVVQLTSLRSKPVVLVFGSYT